MILHEGCGGRGLVGGISPPPSVPPTVFGEIQANIESRAANLLTVEATYDFHGR